MANVFGFIIAALTPLPEPKRSNNHQVNWNNFCGARFALSRSTTSRQAFDCISVGWWLIDR